MRLPGCPSLLIPASEPHPLPPSSCRSLFLQSCLANKPSGARKVALKFFESLLTNLRQPLLIHQAVLLPLDDVLHAGDIRDAPLDSDEQLIFTNILYHVAVRFVGDLDLLTVGWRSSSIRLSKPQPHPPPSPPLPHLLA